MTMIWPFQQLGGGGIPSSITYDLIINEQYPGICFVSTLPGGGYTEVRLVNGCLWIANNATFNPNTEQWEQDSPSNAANPAFARAFCQSGYETRYIAAATNVPGTAVSWVPVETEDTQGNITLSPSTITAPGLVQFLQTVLWNLGAGQGVARRISVTDTSSAAESFLDDLQVNGTSVWTVDKSGTLINGTVPGSAVSGGQKGFYNTTVHADGTNPVTITFSPAYATALTELEITPSFNYSTHPWGVGYCTYNESKTGFTVQFYGAPSGSLLTGFWWKSNGN